MPFFTRESLDSLRQRVDIVELISAYVDLKKAGATYKALCPFHDEKSPSFVVQSGDAHYHCFGCGAHGDAVQFLMEYSRMTFSEAVEALAERFSVMLTYEDNDIQRQGPNKGKMKAALLEACRFYHFYMLHTQEGHEALKYLYNRGLNLDFLKKFEIGLAPKDAGVFLKYMQEKGFDRDILLETGLLTESQYGSDWEFFRGRITFPIKDITGAVIGFSARKYQESTGGGKYVNTPETALFKKSSTLFGLNDCRRRIAKERRAVLVEGQVDALRLIDMGLDMTVAALGTAFGDGHVKQLCQLGVTTIYIAFDGDSAGREACAKVGNLFQNKGVEVLVLPIPEKQDPDTLLNERGIEGFLAMLEHCEDYLSFFVRFLSVNIDVNSPAGKHQIVETISKQVRKWENPVMVHESLRKLARIVEVPEDVVGVHIQSHIPMMRKRSLSSMSNVDPDRILEGDLIRWLLYAEEDRPLFFSCVRHYLKAEYFHVDVCRKVFIAYLEHPELQESREILTLASYCSDKETQLFINDLTNKKINREKAKSLFLSTIQKILDRNWMEQREKIKGEIHSGTHDDDALLELAKTFDELQKSPPSVTWDLFS